MSHDIEDIVVVIDGRPEILEEVSQCDAELRKALASRFTLLLGKNRFIESVFGHMPPDQSSQERVIKVIESFRKIAAYN